MKKCRRIILLIVALMSFFAINISGCLLGALGGSSGENSNGNSGGNNNQQQQAQPPAPEFEGGSGTESAPYIIAKAYQWKNINKHLSSCFELSADLNMGDISDLTPIGSDTAPFTGNLDGKNHRVHSATLNTALFGTISGGTVRNLNFSDSTIKKANASFANTVIMGATVENCHTKSISLLQQSSIYLGGLINTVASAAEVRYCSANIIMTCDSAPIMSAVLICNVNGGKVNGCWVTGSFNCTQGHYVSGMIGDITNGTVTNCFTQCTVLGTSGIGIFAGRLTSMGNTRSGGKMGYCLVLCDFSDFFGASYLNELFYNSTVTLERTLKYYSPSNIESSNDILDTDEWKDNALWKKGKLHPELVSYEEYLQITEQ